MAARFGIEGEDFVWEGEPFNSAALRRTDFFNDAYNYVFTSFTASLDFAVLYGAVNPVEAFGKSEKGKALVNLPYKEDVYDAFLPERAALDAMYAGKINEIVSDYKREIALSGILGYDATLDATWDEYITELKQNGLGEYIDLYGRYPER